MRSAARRPDHGGLAPRAQSAPPFPGRPCRAPLRFGRTGFLRTNRFRSVKRPCTVPRSSRNGREREAGARAQAPCDARSRRNRERGANAGDPKSQTPFRAPSPTLATGFLAAASQACAKLLSGRFDFMAPSRSRHSRYASTHLAPSVPSTERRQRVSIAPGSAPSGTMKTPIDGTAPENSPWAAGGAYPVLRRWAHTLPKARAESRTTPTARRVGRARAAVRIALKFQGNLSTPPRVDDPNPCLGADPLLDHRCVEQVCLVLAFDQEQPVRTNHQPRSPARAFGATIGAPDRGRARLRVFHR